MVIVCLSDTHSYHSDVEVPNGDLLIHAGDVMFSQYPRPLSVLRDFNEWLGGLPHRYKILVPGNHDKLLEEPQNRALVRNAKLLVNSGTSIEGIHVWGSPVTPLCGEAFGMPDATDRTKLWARIPKNTDILITHGPAFGILDVEFGSERHQGCPELRDAILRVRPRLHVFGHVHGGYGKLPTDHTLHVNAALFDELGGVERTPIVVPDFNTVMRKRSR